MNKDVKKYLDSVCVQSDDPRYGWNVEGLNYPKLKYWEQKYEQLMQVSLLSEPSLHFIESMVKATNYLGGVCLEFGTYKGASANVISNATNRDLYCFDSFEGLKGKSEIDGIKEGNFADTNIAVAQSMAPKARMIPGMLPDSLHETLEKYEGFEITFVHMDLDYYNVTRQVLQLLLKKMRCGVIVFDDYGNLKTKGVKIAVDEVLIAHGIQVTPLQTGQAFTIFI